METIMSKFRHHSVSRYFVRHEAGSHFASTPHQSAAQHYEQEITRHYEVLLQSGDSRSLSSDPTSSTSMAQSLQRLSHLLRALLLSMTGENPDLSDPSFNVSFDPDCDKPGVVNLSALEQLIDTLYAKAGGYLGQEGREDWAQEREYEIARLERENDALRGLLGIDEASMAASGITLELDRVESGRYSTFLSSSGKKGGDTYTIRQPYWDAQQFQQMGGGAAPKRAMDFHSGMRLGTPGQSRRTGIFGGGQQRSSWSSGIGVGSPVSPGTSQWTNQPASPVISIDRSPPWQDFDR
jgi:hypothetical protein